MTAALTNADITVVAIFTNAGPELLSGFYYTDHVPTDLQVSTVSVTINGQNTTNFAFETGQDSDVYSGTTPRRWILEHPPAFSEANSIVPGEVVEIVYSISSPTPGWFRLPQFTWVALGRDATNAVFGSNESKDALTLLFLESPKPVLTISQTGPEFGFRVTGLPGFRYCVEASADLLNWTPVTTNTFSFEILDPGDASVSAKFYRALWLP